MLISNREGRTCGPRHVRGCSLRNTCQAWLWSIEARSPCHLWELGAQRQPRHPDVQPPMSTVAQPLDSRDERLPLG